MSKKPMFTFELDKNNMKYLEDTFKKAKELPRRKVTLSVRRAMKIPLGKAKKILRSIPDNYKMKFKDGNTWTKQDVIKNLYLKRERTYSRDKTVYRLGIRDWRVDLYANFVEFGYTNPKTGEVHEASHFMRDSLDKTADIVYDVSIRGITIALKELGLLE